jgi:hypothetical protein
MEATQKRRMWKVAIVHFLLSVVVWWKLNDFPCFFLMPTPPLFETCLDIYYFLQPLLWVCLKLGFTLIKDSTVLYYFSIPLWSICFGWLFVKFDNWLNHFPVLGKRVF